MGTEIMAEGASPGPEVVSAGPPTGPAGAEGQQVLPQASDEVKPQVTPLANQLEQPQKTASSAPVQRTPFEEMFHQMSGKERMDFLRALPLDQRLKVMTGFKEFQIAGGSGENIREEFKEGITIQSRFEQVCSNFEALADIDTSRFTPELKAKFDKASEATIREMHELINAGLEGNILAFTRKEIIRIYDEVRPKPPPRKVDSDWSSPQPIPASLDERLKKVDDALGMTKDEETGKMTYHYKETFWNYQKSLLVEAFGYSNIARLKGKIKGFASYMAGKVAFSIRKELTEPEFPLNPQDLGDFYLLDIKRGLQQEEEKEAIERRERRKRATRQERLPYNSWREKFEFTWAETPEELRDTVFEWLDWFQQQLPAEAEATVYEAIKTGRHNAIGSLERALNNLSIPPESPIAKELRATIEGYVAVIGGVRLLESGKQGFEAYTNFLEEFGKNFNLHNDSIYLGNEKSAIILDFLSENDGAICHGGPDDIEKPEHGDTEAYRAKIAEEAILHAATRELYIRTSDFEAAEATRYGWEDQIEELLLVDKKHRDEADKIKITDPAAYTAAIAKIDKRTSIFQNIKNRHDKEDKDLAGLISKDQRNNVIRGRILKQMETKANKTLFEQVKGITDPAAKDRALWKWVKDYNASRAKHGLDGWFPSAWDMVRLSIDRPTKLVDRVLSKEEFRSLVEEVKDPCMGLTEEQIKEEMVGEFEGRIEEIRDEIRLEIAPFDLPYAEAEALLEQKFKEREQAHYRKIQNTLFNQQDRLNEAKRAFNINMAYQKFLGVEARWGGLTTREIDDDGKVILKTISSLAGEILKKKIDKEEDDIKKEVEEYVRKELDGRNLTQEQIDASKLKKTRHLRQTKVFGATLGLREIGIANDLPIWNYYYYSDPAMIQAFAPLVGLTHNDKEKIIELLERGRREMEAVFSYLADQYMDKQGSGKSLAVEDDPKGGESLVVEHDPIGNFHRETWERARVINEGGELALRDLFESRFMISTSGGVKVPDLISKIADLGVYDLLWENGCKDFREFQGFIKRRDEYELWQQSFWNTRKWADPVSYAQRVRGASVARTFLVGGEVQGQGKVPGVLNEVMKGAWRFRREILKAERWLDRTIREKLREYESPATIDEAIKDLQEKLESGTVDPMNLITPTAKDELIEVGGDIIGFVRQYMQSLDYLRNKAGYAPKNWQYTNDLIARAYFKELAKREVVKAIPGEDIKDKDGKVIGRYEGGEIVPGGKGGGAEALGGQGQSFAPQGRSRLAIEIYEAVLRGSSYEILDQHNATVLNIQARDTKEAMDQKRKDIVDDIVANGLPPEVQRKIDNRITILKKDYGMEQRIIELRAKGIPDHENESLINLNRESERLKKAYIERRLHEEFVGEWAARAA